MDQIRNLLWLKARLTLALYRKRKSMLALLLLTLPFTLAFNLALYFGGLVALWSLPPENSRELLNGALTAIYAMWLLGPMFGVSLNEGYDLTKLLHYPVSGRRIFLANILGSVMDPPVMFLVVPLACIPVALGNSPLTAALIVGVLLVFLFHTLSLSQALLTLLWGLLRSRRIADSWKVFVGLAGSIFWVTYQVAIRRMDRMMPGLVMARPARFTRFLPSGLAADAVMAIHRGAVTDFAWRAGVLLALCIATVALAGSLVQRVTAGDLVLDRVGQAKRRQAEKAAKQRIAPRLNPISWLPSTTGAVLQKELRTYLRDPQAKVELFQRMGALIAWPLIFLSSSHRDISLSEVSRAGTFLFLAPMGAMVLMLLSTASNVFARDRNGLSLLFTMPTPREALFYGKNIALLTLFTPMNLFTVLAIAAMTRAWAAALPALIVTECLMVMSLGEGNVFSVYTPYPLPEKGRNPYMGNQNFSCLGCIGGMLGFAAFTVLAVPVALAFLAPLLWMPRIWMLATLPAAMAFSGFAYYLATAWSARALTRREPEILQVILRTPG